MDAPREDTPRGLFGSLRSLIARVIAVLHGRAELFSTELEEEITRLIGVLIWSFIAALCGVIGTTFVAVTVLLAVPEHYRAWTAGGMAILFFVVVLLGVRSIRKIVRAKTRPFDASLRELEKDRDQLRNRG